MNYLAHSFLSFSEEQLVGNMIADFIKNSERENYPLEIQKGIRIHREIDTFTDGNPIIHQAKKVFSPLVRLYAGAFVDVSFDYFLANDLSINSIENWKKHSQKVYQTLWKHEEYLPDKFKLTLRRMEKDDWLYNYRNEWGIQFSFQNVLNKSKYLEDSLPVFPLFQQNKTTLQKSYIEFFPILQRHIMDLEISLR